MCFAEGKPTEFTMGVPEDVKAMRNSLIQMLTSGLGRGATPYGGPIAPQTNPMMLGAANMLNQMMGYGQYKQPGYMSYPGQYPTSGLTVPSPTQEDKEEDDDDGDKDGNNRGPRPPRRPRRPR